MNGYFITGTDTNAGKTYVSCALARRAIAIGHKVLAFKPIETGCLDTGNGLRGEDQERLAEAAGNWQTGTLRGVYRLPLPAAPLVAAEVADTAIDLELLEQTARTGFATSEASLLLVEGAGGWRVPITREADMATLAQRFRLPVVIAARAGLGTINHSLLTIEAIQRDGLEVAALVLSEHETEDRTVTLSNRTEIARRWPGRIIILRADDSALNPLIPGR
jgi:dethiobiotin synthetase